jgi:transcriptional regulator with XRE-family HTH domain
MGSTIYSNEHRAFVTLLRELREGAGLTQEELAARLERDQPWVSVVESGQRRIDVVELREMCKALAIDSVEFMKMLEDRRLAG